MILVLSLQWTWWGKAGKEGLYDLWSKLLTGGGVSDADVMSSSFARWQGVRSIADGTSSSACTRRLLAWVSSRRPAVKGLVHMLSSCTQEGAATYLFIRLVLVRALLTILVVFVVLISEVALLAILIEALVLESFAREPVDGAGNELFLDVFAKLIVEFQTLFNVRGSVLRLGVFIVFFIFFGRLGWVEEIEEGLGRDGLLDDTGLFGVWEKNLVFRDESYVRNGQDSRLLRCFFCSTRTVRSLPAFQSILSPSAWS